MCENEIENFIYDKDQICKTYVHMFASIYFGIKLFLVNVYVDQYKNLTFQTILSFL